MQDNVVIKYLSSTTSYPNSKNRTAVPATIHRQVRDHPPQEGSKHTNTDPHGAFYFEDPNIGLKSQYLDTFTLFTFQISGR